jgi:hypothetical protein
MFYTTAIVLSNRIAHGPSVCAKAAEGASQTDIFIYIVQMLHPNANSKSVHY